MSDRIQYGQASEVQTYLPPPPFGPQLQFYPLSPRIGRPGPQWRREAQSCWESYRRFFFLRLTAYIVLSVGVSEVMKAHAFIGLNDWPGLKFNALYVFFSLLLTLVMVTMFCRAIGIICCWDQEEHPRRKKFDLDYHCVIAGMAFVGSVFELAAALELEYAFRDQEWEWRKSDYWRQNKRYGGIAITFVGAFLLILLAFLMDRKWRRDRMEGQGLFGDVPLSPVVFTPQTITKVSDISSTPAIAMPEDEVPPP